jgi:hypothetical protein
MVSCLWWQLSKYQKWLDDCAGHPDLPMIRQENDFPEPDDFRVVKEFVGSNGPERSSVKLPRDENLSRKLVARLRYLEVGLPRGVNPEVKKLRDTPCFSKCLYV